MTLEPERRAALLATKLAALVRAHGDDVRWLDGAVAAPMGADPGLVADGIGWVLADERPERSMGRALAWAGAHDVEQLHVFAERAAGDLARRAALFSLGDGAPTVWSVDGTTVERAAPVAPAVASELSDAERALGATIAAAGADVVVEHGVLTGEVEGLEVARVVDDVDGLRIEVGVGRHDREAFAMVHGDLPTEDALAKVIATVRAERRAGRPPHPLNRLVAQRWLRHAVLRDPTLVGLAADDHLEPVPGTVARTSLHDVDPAFAIVRDGTGALAVLVACSVGVDLDLVPDAVDLWAAIGPEAEVRLAVPPRDALAVTERLAAAAVAPVVVHPVDERWRA